MIPPDSGWWGKDRSALPAEQEQISNDARKQRSLSNSPGSSA